MSLTGKAESISHGRNAVRYAETKKVDGKVIARELERNGLVGDSPDEHWSEMQRWKNLTGHSNIKRDTLWLLIAPSRELAEQLDNGGIRLNDDTIKTWQDLLNDFLKEMQLENTMRVSVLHDRTERKKNGRSHIHIAMSRIDLDGNVISDKNIGKRAGEAAARVLERYNLKRPEGKKFKAKKQIGIEKRGYIRSIALRELAALPHFSYGDYKAALAAHGINLIPYKDGKGNVKGYRMSIGEDGFQYKVYDIDRRLTAANIEKTYQRLRHTQTLELKGSHVRKDAKGNCFVGGTLRNGVILPEVKISNKDYIDYRKGRVTREQLAAKYLLGKLSSTGAGKQVDKREWEISDGPSMDDLDRQTGIKL